MPCHALNQRPTVCGYFSQNIRSSLQHQLTLLTHQWNLDLTGFTKWTKVGQILEKVGDDHPCDNNKPSWQIFLTHTFPKNNWIIRILHVYRRFKALMGWWTSILYTFWLDPPTTRKPIWTAKNKARYCWGDSCPFCRFLLFCCLLLILQIKGILHVYRRFKALLDWLDWLTSILLTLWFDPPTIRKHIPTAENKARHCRV